MQNKTKRIGLCVWKFPEISGGKFPEIYPNLSGKFLNIFFTLYFFKL